MHPTGTFRKKTNRFSLQKFWEGGRRHHQEVTLIQKKPESAKSLIKQSSQQKSRTSYSVKKAVVRKAKFACRAYRNGQGVAVIKCLTQFEKAEEICELRKKTLSLHGSVEDKDKSVDSAQLTLDRLPATNSRFAGNSTCFTGFPRF